MYKISDIFQKHPVNNKSHYLWVFLTTGNSFYKSLRVYIFAIRENINGLGQFLLNKEGNICPSTTFRTSIILWLAFLCFWSLNAFELFVDASTNFLNILFLPKQSYICQLLDAVLDISKLWMLFQTIVQISHLDFNSLYFMSKY